MSDNEQRSSSSDIDNLSAQPANGAGTPASADHQEADSSHDERTGSDHISSGSMGDAGKSKESEAAPSPSTHEPRIPLVHPGNNGIALVIAGIVAAIMTVAFIMPADSIFPRPVSESAEIESSSGASSSSEEKPSTTTSGESESTTEPKTSEEPTQTTEPATTAPESKKSGTVRVPQEGSTAHSLTLVAPVRVLAQSSTGSEAGSADARPGLITRIGLLIKLAILICLATVCGLVVLGGMALAQDRPLGDVTTALCKLFACSWLATLALLVPSPSEWLQTAIHYVVGMAIFWCLSMLWFRFSPRLATVLLGGSMALLAATALGARLVVWATWT